MNTKSTEGRRRMTILLSGTSGVTCATAMAIVLLLYGTPYDPVWWLIMVAVLVSSVVVPRFLVPLVEWVIDGYRMSDQ